MQHKATIFYEWEQGKSAYSFPFPYLSKQFVKVRVDHANASTLLEYNRDYTIEGQTLTLTPVHPFVSGATLCIYRQTPTGSLVDFSDGSLLLASEMDRLSTQLLHVEEENSDLIASTGMFADDDNSWQGQGRRIKNLSDPVDAHDAVTLSHLDKVGVARREEIETVAVRAENAASTAEQHRDKANEARIRAEAANTAAEKAARDANSSEASAIANASYIRDQIVKVDTAVSNMQSNLTSMNSAVHLANGYAERCTYERERSESISTNMLKMRAEVENARNEAAASAKQAVAIVGFTGVVDTSMIADGAVTASKLALDVDTLIKNTKPRRPEYTFTDPCLYNDAKAVHSTMPNLKDYYTALPLLKTWMDTTKWDYLIVEYCRPLNNSIDVYPLTIPYPLYLTSSSTLFMSPIILDKTEMVVKVYPVYHSSLAIKSVKLTEMN